MAKSSQRSVMTNHFSQVPKADIQRSSFDRSHGYKTTFDAGYLVPFLVDEGLPGDTFNVGLTALARLATPIYPTMDNMFIDTFFFAVPNRLLWDNWERFNGAQTNPDDSTDFIIPTITQGTQTPGEPTTLSDYFGIPPVEGLEHSAFWHRAYNLIYRDWFRDENLQDSPIINTGDGPDDPADYTLLRRGKRHDYFTSSLPWPSKNQDNEPVTIPLGTTAPIIGFGALDAATSGAPSTFNQTDKPSAPTNNPSNVSLSWVAETDGGTPLNPKIYADLTDATAATINQLRQAFQIQRMFERDARGGTRYTEIIKAHFGVTSPDARLQRPEYLGGGSTPLLISPLASTVPTDLGGTTPQGNLAGVGTASIGGNGFTKSFTEHVTIIGLMAARADLTYQQGLNRMWSRSTRFDFYWGALSHIGEMAVKNKEIYAQGTLDPLADEETWGYQERYAEYRYKPSQITGQFRSSFLTPLDAWHLSQNFAALPFLGSDFIEDNPPVDRIIAVQTEPHFIFDSYISMRCARPMPLYGTPGLIDHF